MDRFVEAIYPRKKTVEMDDGTTIPITRKPLRRPPVASPVAPQDGKKPHGRDIAFSAFKWKSCLVYLDDVIVFSQDLKSHSTHVEAILETLSETGIKLKLVKCRFFTDTVKYLGYVIRPGTLEVDEVATAALTKAKPPKTQTELRSFLGLCNFYRRFVPNYS